MLEATRYDLFLIMACYYVWLGKKNNKNKTWRAASLREPGERQAERAVLADLCVTQPWALKGACPVTVLCSE